MERRLTAGLLVLVLSASVILAYAAPPPKITLEDVYNKLIVIEGKLLSPQRASSLDTVPKVVTRGGSKTFPAGTVGFAYVVQVSASYDKSFDVSLTVCTTYPAPPPGQHLTIGLIVGNATSFVSTGPYDWYGGEIPGTHIVRFAARGFMLYFYLNTALPSDVTVYYDYTVTTTAGVEVVETIY